MARQHGWPIDFIFNHWSTKFVLVVTVSQIPIEVAVAPQSESQLAELHVFY
jgi:hypothetical protein